MCDMMRQFNGQEETFGIAIRKREKGKMCNLSDVLYVPKVSYNLLSMSKSTDTIKSTVSMSKGCDYLNSEGNPAKNVTS